MRAAVAIPVLLLAGAVHAQIAQPPRDRPSVPQTGTGTIKGRVVDAETGSGIARARVRLVTLGAAGESAVTTDGSGNFVFGRLPAASFTIQVSKATYVLAVYPEPGTTFRSGGRRLTLDAGQTIDNVLVRLYRGGAIVGHAIDAYGDPVESVNISAMRLPKWGRGSPQMRGSSMTNDLGEYRLGRLEPGQYVLMATPQRGMTSGPPRDGDTEPQPVPTFYPGVASIDLAQPIRLERGATLSGIDVLLLEGTIATVSGVLVDASGQPVTRGGSISVRQVLKNVRQNWGAMSGAGIRPDGTFQLRLPPGEYVLEGRTAPAPGAPFSPNDSQGFLPVTVTGDVGGLTVQLGPGAKLTGRVVFDGSISIPPADQVNTPTPIVFSSDTGECRTSRTELAPDWTFTVQGLFGTCMVRLVAVPRWMPRSILIDGNDVTDRPIRFAPGQEIRGVEVVMTDRSTKLDLHVTDEQGNLTRDFVALVFPVDQARWTDMGGRYIRPFVPPRDPPREPVRAQSGVSAPASVPSTRDTITAMPAGEYYAIALDDLETDGFREPDLLRQLARGATRVKLVEGASAEITLRRISIR